jgi:NADH-quinone oxidoreductase subunit K
MLDSYFLAGALFCMGFWGLLVRRNLISILICFQLMFVSTLFLLSLFSRSFGDIIGQNLAFYMLCLVLLWTTVSLSLIIYLYRSSNTLRADYIDQAI